MIVPILALLLASGASSLPQGVALAIVDGEAGLAPVPPRQEDIKIPSDTGHAYWVDPRSVVSTPLAGVELTVKDWDPAYRTPVLKLRLTESARRDVSEFTAAHQGAMMAFLLDGQVIGHPIKIIVRVDTQVMDMPVEAEGAAARIIADELRRAAQTYRQSASGA